MKPMAYEHACEYYYNVVLDIARQQSTNIFTVITEAVKDASILDDMEDIMEEWYGLRKSIVDEMRG